MRGGGQLHEETRRRGALAGVGGPGGSDVWVGVVVYVMGEETRRRDALCGMGEPGGSDVWVGLVVYVMGGSARMRRWHSHPSTLPASPPPRALACSQQFM